VKVLLFFCFWFLTSAGWAQMHFSIDTLRPPADYENVYSQKMASDSLQSTFIIWIKKDVKGHFHQLHTENIIVLEGKAEMLFNGKSIIVKKGDYLNIPFGTTHSVTRVLSRKPLKVISIQSPNFDGTDRVFIEQSVQQ
jgi:mannose-6-phosphate isomerase-like protein (cupin superfamily)